VSYFSERRADRVTSAEQRRADQALAAQLRREDQRVSQERRREQAEWKAGRRRAAMTAATTWLTGHVEHALFGVIIVVPAVLAWSAMAAYGHSLYGPVGVLLPLFSEASMWVFAAATTRAVREQRPTSGLRLGTWTSAGVAAALNYLHGAQVSPRTGVVMAIVSIGGLVVHQLVTAGPRRVRLARPERQAARRAAVMRRALLARAVGEVDAEGAVRLVVTPGRITLRRAGITRRWQAVPAAAATVPGPAPTTTSTTLTRWVDTVENQIAVWAREPGGPARTRPAGTTGGTQGEPDGAVGPDLADWITRARTEITAGRLSTQPSKREVARVLHVRAATAGRIARALKGGPDDPDAGHLARA
jgi:hypothetical protein